MTRLTVNERPLAFDMDPQTPLLWALRDATNLTGTKYGCGTGECGACMVLIDGAAQPSCQITLAEAEGSAVTTIEGLKSPDGTLHKVQQAWIEAQVPQCGYCQSGQIMAAVALIDRVGSPSDEQIDEVMTNICRCGTYPRIRAAIHAATGKAAAVKGDA